MRRARGGARARQQRRTGAPARTAPLRTAPVHAARCAPRPRGTRTARQRGPAAARRSCTGVARRGAAARRAARRGAARGARAAPLRAARRCARRRLCSEGSPAARPPGDRGARSRGACGRESAAEIGLWAKWGRGLRRSRMAAEPVLLRAQAPARPPRRTPRHPPRRACCAIPPPPPPSPLGCGSPASPAARCTRRGLQGGGAKFLGGRRRRRWAGWVRGREERGPAPSPDTALWATGGWQMGAAARGLAAGAAGPRRLAVKFYSRRPGSRQRRAPKGGGGLRGQGKVGRAGPSGW
jgi:hypothetical protein